MEIIAYIEGETSVRRDVPEDELPGLLERDDAVIWVDIDVRTKQELAVAEKLYKNVFGFHHLTIEDCREARNQPKVEEFPDYLFFIVHGIKPQTKTSNFSPKNWTDTSVRNFVVTNRNEDFRSIDEVKRQLAEESSSLSKRRGLSAASDARQDRRFLYADR